MYCSVHLNLVCVPSTSTILYTRSLISRVNSLYAFYFLYLETSIISTLHFLFTNKHIHRLCLFYIHIFHTHRKHTRTLCIYVYIFCYCELLGALQRTVTCEFVLQINRERGAVKLSFPFTLREGNIAHKSLWVWDHNGKTSRAS